MKNPIKSKLLTFVASSPAMATKVSSLPLIGFFIIFFPRGLQEESAIRAEPLHLVMMRPFLFLLHRLPSQEFVFFLLFLAVRRAFRIVPLHFHAFFRGELRKMANKAHQLPTIFLRAVRAAKRRHACEAHTIFDNPENFTIRELLRLLPPQVRRFRIEIAAEWRIAAPVVGVADGAVVGEV